MIITDRTGAGRIVHPALLIDIPKVRPYLYNACEGVQLDNLKTYIPNYETNEPTANETIEAIDKVLPFLFDNTDNIDIVMIRQGFVCYMGKDWEYTKVPVYVKPPDLTMYERISVMARLGQEIDERLLAMSKIEDKTSQEYKDNQAEIKGIQMLGKHLGLIERTENMIDKLEIGTTITDRNGKEYKGYSYLWNERNEAMDLLMKIDTVNLGNNTDEESAKALIEIVYRTFDRKVSKDEILESLDIELIRNCISCYYDIN